MKPLSRRTTLITLFLGFLLIYVGAFGSTALTQLPFQQLSISSIEQIILKEHDSTYSRVACSGITAMPNGRLFASWVGITQDGLAMEPPYGMYSDDSGKTWGTPFPITMRGPCLVVGTKVFSFNIKVTGNWPTGTCRGYYKISTDSGVTWGLEYLLPHPYVWMPSVTNPIRTRAGVMFVGASWARTLGVFFWRASVYRSFDNGQTWSLGGAIPDVPESFEGLDEPALVERSDGSIYAILRTRCSNTADARHYYSVTYDNGDSWSQPVKIENMHSVTTMACLKRFSWIPNVVVVAWIDRTSGGYHDRRPLVAAISYDDCDTWTYKTTLDPLTGLSGHDFSMEITQDNHVILGYRRSLTSSPYSDDAVAVRFFVGNGPSQPYVCGTCGANFATQSELDTHIADVHGSQPYVCEVCGAELYTQEELDTHMTTVHGQPPPPPNLLDNLIMRVSIVVLGCCLVYVSAVPHLRSKRIYFSNKRRRRKKG